MGCPQSYFLLDLGGVKRGQKTAFFGGPKSPILARGHMGNTAVFNQIVLYLETLKWDNLRPSRPLQALTPSNKGAPWDWSTLYLLIPFLNSLWMPAATSVDDPGLYFV